MGARKGRDNLLSWLPPIYLQHCNQLLTLCEKKKTRGTDDKVAFKAASRAPNGWWMWMG